LKSLVTKDAVTWGKSVLDTIKNRIDWSKRGGAILLGVKGRVFVAHGCSDAVAIENAIKLAYKNCERF
jgi:glycerol-3-phosphate acyltransferase PlsX